MKKSIAILVTLFMLASLFGGCTSDTESSSTPVAGTPESSAGTAGNSEPSEPEPAADGGSGEVAELRFTSWANTGEIAVLSRAVDAYNASQNNVKIVFESSASDTYEQKLITALSGGDAWDVFYAGDSTIAKLIQNQSIAKLNDFLASPDSFCTESDFADGLWGAARTSEGDIYGLTVDCNPNLLYYQPKMMEEIGAKSPQEYFDEDNWTWDAFDEILTKLQEADKQGFLLGGDAISVYRFVSGAGGTIWNGDTYQFDDKAKEALQYCADRIKDGRFTYSGLLPEGQGEDAQFISGLCGFSNAGRWNTPTFYEAGVEHDYIPYPSKDGSKFPPSLISTAYLSVNANSPHLEEAMKFATYYCSQDGQRVRLESTDGSPGNAIPSIGGIDEIITESGIPEHVGYLFDVRETGWALGGDFAKDALYPGMSDELKSILEEIWVNGATVEETLPKLEAKANEMVEEFKNS